MFYLRRPSNETIRQWLSEQSTEQFTYEMIGATKDASMPSSFHHIDWSVEIGSGRRVFDVASKALEQWQSFNLEWTRVFGEGQPSVGKHIGVAARAGGLWTVNFCRVIEVSCQPNSYSVIVGTMPRHVACGEENLSVVWEPDSDRVLFNIRSFSRPRVSWTRLATPIIRRQQNRFCRDATKAMTRFIRAYDPVPSTPRSVTSTLGYGMPEAHETGSIG